MLVTTLLPRAPADVDERLQVAGRLTNCGTEVLEGLRVRLAVGKRIFRRSGLALADATPLTGGRRLPAEPVAAPLAPGASTAFSLVVRVGDLRLGRQNGVWPLAVQVQRGDADLVGVASSFVPWFPAGEIAPTRIAWLVPLVDEPRRAPAEVLLDDELDALVSDAPDDRGRLFRALLSGVVGSTPTCEPAAAALPERRSRSSVEARCRTEPVPITYAVDPDLLFTLSAMTSPYTVLPPGGRAVERPASQHASRWLTALRAAAMDGDVLALPYGDPDVAALARSGTGLRDDAPLLRTLGVTTTRDVLGVPPQTSLAWLPPGPVGGAVDTLAGEASSPTALVLDPTAFPLPRAGPGDRTPSARVELASAAAGEVTGLVADPALSALVQPDPAAASWQGQRLAEQRWIAEAAALTAERPSESRTIVVAPGRQADLVPAVAIGAISATGRLPFLCPVALAEVAAGRERCSSVPAGSTGIPLLPPQPPAAAETRGTPLAVDASADLLPEGYVTDLAAVRRSSDQLTDEILLAGSRPQAVAKARLLRARGRAESVAWRTDTGGGRRLLRLLNEDVATLRQKVQLRGAPVLLTGRSGTVQISVENALDQPVTIGVRLDETTAARLVSDDIAVAEVPGRVVRTVDIRVTARTSGRFVARAQLVGRDGEPFGDPVLLPVTSSGYGPVALGVTGVAAGVLFVAVGIRLVRRALGARGSPSGGAG